MPVEKISVHWDELFEHDENQRPKFPTKPAPPPSSPIYVTDPRQPMKRIRLGGPMDMRNPFADFH